MTAPDRAKLRALAEAAPMNWYVLEDLEDINIHEADFIAEASPATIIALLDMLDAKDAQERARDALDFLPTEHSPATTPQPAPLSAVDDGACQKGFDAWWEAHHFDTLVQGKDGSAWELWKEAWIAAGGAVHG